MKNESCFIIWKGMWESEEAKKQREIRIMTSFLQPIRSSRTWRGTELICLYPGRLKTPQLDRWDLYFTPGLLSLPLFTLTSYFSHSWSKSKCLQKNPYVFYWQDQPWRQKKRERRNETKLRVSLISFWPITCLPLGAVWFLLGGEKFRGNTSCIQMNSCKDRKCT